MQLVGRIKSDALSLVSFSLGRTFYVLSLIYIIGEGEDESLKSLSIFQREVYILLDKELVQW